MHPPVQLHDALVRTSLRLTTLGRSRFMKKQNGPAGDGNRKRPYYVVTAFNPLNGIVETQEGIDRYRRMVHQALLARDAKKAQAKATG